MVNAEENGSVTTNDSDLRVSLFADLRVTRLGRVYEKQALDAGFRFVAGVDEVGRGCLAGPVVAAACILDLSKPLPSKIDDSKKLTPEIREEIALQLRAESVCFAIGQVEADVIDKINILQATKLAMLQAIDSLSQAADFLLIDALR